MHFLQCIAGNGKNSDCLSIKLNQLINKSKNENLLRTYKVNNKQLMLKSSKRKRMEQKYNKTASRIYSREL